MIKLILMRIKLYKLCKKHKSVLEGVAEIRELKRRLYEAERIYLYNQRVFTYCPTCGCELLSSDRCTISEPDLVVLKCHNCDTESIWDFNAPAPFLVHYRKL